LKFCGFLKEKYLIATNYLSHPHNHLNTEMRGSYQKETKNSSAGVSRSKVAAIARKKAIMEDNSSVFSSSQLKEAISTGIDDAGGGGSNNKGRSSRKNINNKRRANRGGSEDDDEITMEAYGVVSTSVTAGAGAGGAGASGADSNNSDEEDNNMDVDMSRVIDVSTLNSILEEMTSSRPEERKSGLATMLHRVMRTSLQSKEIREFVLLSMLDTLKGALLKSISRLTSADHENEAYLSFNLVCTLGLLVGGDQEDYFVFFYQVLKKLSVNEAVGDTIQSQALFTLSFLAYVNSTDSFDSVIDFIEDMIVHGPNEVAEVPYLQACKSWVLLSSAIEDDWVIVKRARQRVFRAVCSILENSMDIEGRTVSGLTIAYMYEVSHRLTVDVLDDNVELRTPRVAPDDDTYEEEMARMREIIDAISTVTLDSVRDDPSKELGKILSTSIAAVDKYLAILKAITRESSKRISRKDRKETRAVFREIEHYVFSLKAPCSKIRFSGATIEATSFQELAFLEDVKAVLGAGFQGALRSFPVICDMFQVEFLEAADMESKNNKGTKVQKGSKEDRNRFKHRRGEEKLSDKHR
jgi:hypothetical protein